MGVEYLWDTNTAIYYLKNVLPEEGAFFIDNIVRETTPAISVITEIELMCWKTANTNDITVLKSFINDCFVFELEKEIKEQTSELRKSFSIKLPDAIIAATAVVKGLTLITRNFKDFQKISSIEIINPFEI